MANKTDSKIGIRPLRDDILVETMSVKTKVEKKGLTDPNKDKKGNKKDDYDDHPFQAIVRKIGPEYDGDINIGDVIFYIGGDGNPIIYNGSDKYLILKSDRILGVKEF